MTPPTPAAVRAAMKETSEGCTAEESRALCADNRLTDELLRAHIRAIAQEMRKESAAARVNTVDPFTAPAVRDAELAAAQMLKGFADKLEGKQNENT